MSGRKDAKMGNWKGFQLDDRQSLPRLAGVYAIYHNGALVYIGSAFDLRGRIAGHMGEKHSSYRSKSSEWAYLTGALTGKYRLSHKYGDWKMIELRLIRRLRPIHNKHGKGACA